MDSRRPCRIALVNNDPAIASPILSILRGAGHMCRRFASGTAALREIDGDSFDLLLIERTLADISAADVMTSVRARLGFALPVIGLVPADDADGASAMLEDGADDCLVRPVPPRLLLAQIDAAMRRASGRGPRIEASVGHLTFQPEGTRVYVDQAPIVLTAKEYALALMLCRHLGKPLGRETILSAIWGDGLAPLTRTLDVHVSRLRTKLEMRPVRGFSLSALYGRGYRLDYAPAAARPGETKALIPRRSASPSAPLPAAHRPQAR